MPIKITRLLPPKDWRKKQLDTLRKVGRKNYETRIKIPSKRPIKSGIEAEPRYADEMRKVIDEKRRAKGLATVTDDEWLTYAMKIGAPRLVEGVIKREPKVKKFIDTWSPLLSTHLGRIDPMSTETWPDRKQRMITNAEGLKALHGKWKGGGA